MKSGILIVSYLVAEAARNEILVPSQGVLWPDEAAAGEEGEPQKF